MLPPMRCSMKLKNETEHCKQSGAAVRGPQECSAGTIFERA